MIAPLRKIIATHTIEHQPLHRKKPTKIRHWELECGHFKYVTKGRKKPKRARCWQCTWRESEKRALQKP